jgi:probable rRNA maturation factor
MAHLNYQYRGKDGPTNVLSFSQREGEIESAHPHLLGDIVISGDRAADDARELNYTNDEMVLYLLIHGILHLVGYEHQEPSQASTMAQMVEDIFQKFYPSLPE